MTEAERRRSYAESRVLINSDAILTTTFDDGVLYFTGEQIELMRNLMQYANRIESYAAEYEPGYYLTPDDTDWDSIQAIVADLEETLMGNPNTLWGYKDRYAVQQQEDAGGIGSFTINLDGPPEGEVWVIMGVGVYRSVNNAQYARLQVNTTSGAASLEDIAMPLAGTFYGSISECILKYTDNIRVIYTAATDGETVITTSWGYKMVVP